MADVGLETVGIGRQGQGVGLAQVKVAGLDLAWPRVVEIYGSIPSNTHPCTEIRSIKLNSLE